MTEFDDGRLDDAAVLADAEDLLRPLAESGARVRRAYAEAEQALARVSDDDRPRAVVVMGPESRLVRAIMEPTCPVPLVAWPYDGLPGWVGPLDVVVVLGGADVSLAASAHEALRRGARLLVAAASDSPLIARVESRDTTLLPASGSDPFVGAVIALAALQRWGLASEIDVDAVAGGLDAVASDCSHTLDLATNPAKTLALELADTTPLVWGGSVMAARASRRVAEAVREASVRVALAADADALAPLLIGAEPRDPFADPFEGADEGRFSLVLLDDEFGGDAADRDRERLVAAAEHADVRVSAIRSDAGTPLERYATMVARGRFGAAYLQIGLGRTKGWR